MAVPRKVIITVGGVPFEELTEEHKQKIIKRNTDIAAEIVTREAVKMAKDGKSLEEIAEFLGLDKEVYR